MGTDTSTGKLFRGHGEGVMAGNRGFNLVSCKHESDHIRPIMFNLCYGIGTTAKVVTHFRSWNLVLLRAYKSDVLNVQQFTDVFVYYQHQGFRQTDIIVHYEGLDLGQGYPIIEMYSVEFMNMISGCNYQVRPSEL